MEFVKSGSVPSYAFFYLNYKTDACTGESYEDFGFKRDSVVMTQEEFDDLMKKIGNK